jgi:nucleotide-binding universal stress UspA family protein
MIKTIVVGVDGSDGSRRALEWTAEQATELHADVVAVFALPSASEFVLSVPPLPEDGVHDLRRSFEAQWCRPLRDAGVPYRSHMIEELPAHALGAHGHGGFAKRLLGSVSYAVSRAAPCPVVIIPSEAHAA